MVTGELKNKIDSIWDTLWTGGITNGITVLEQITYLMFMKLLDDNQLKQEASANALGVPLRKKVFGDGICVMELTLMLEICEEESTYTDVKTISVDSLDVNLVEPIKPLIPHDYIITFDHYYSNNCLMSEERCVPYLQISGKFEWNVPYEAISVKDFIISNEIDVNKPIVVNVDSGWGGNDIDFPEILEWLIFALPAIKEGLETTASLFTFIDYFNKIYKHFEGKNKKLASPDDVCEAIRKRETWTIDELKGLIGVGDVRILNICMAGSGYRKVGNKYYKKNNILKQIVRDDHYEKKVWGKYKQKNDGYDDICQLVHDFNKNLTQLMYQSYYITRSALK